MTWVIGAASIMSTGTLISDARVQFSNGETADMLQKIHRIDNYIGAGFAGSVQIGFALIASLKTFLNTLSETHEHEQYAFEPAAVAREWAPIARDIYDRAAEIEKRNGAQIIMVGISPTENMGHQNFPKVYVIRFAKPDFEPRFISRGLKMCSIGSGAAVTQYKHALRPLFRITSGIHQSFMAGTHQWARNLAFCATTAIRDYPGRGISEHFHVLAIRLGDMILLTNDMITYPKEGPPIVLAMPPVAQTWEEFSRMASARDTSAASAIC